MAVRGLEKHVKVPFDRIESPIHLIESRQDRILLSLFELAKWFIE